MALISGTLEEGKNQVSIPEINRIATLNQMYYASKVSAEFVNSQL
jgi:hypothetical protein